MPSTQPHPSRRALVVSAALLPLAGCAPASRNTTGSATAPGRGSAAPSVPAAPSSSAAASRDAAYFAALERHHGVRMGLYAVATGSGAVVAHRADERFAFCSTFKTLAAAAVLHYRPLSHLDAHVTYTRADVDSISPVTEHHIATGMTVRQLCDAAIRYSDGTAGNLLMRDIGGPARLTGYLRELGDTVSRMDQYEPRLNRVGPHDPRDTTTPRAIAADYRALVLGDALPPGRRALLRGWLERCTTGGARIRAALPKGWRIAHKTGTGDYGRAHDVAVVWPPHTEPLVVAVMTDRAGYRTPPVESVIAGAAARVVATLT